ncbi:hypothetical protein ACOACO_13080 [Nocardioides sp. CPCC 205120]|uniref:hypothetical protein n=1 Tax=Nocardioides sp. CPCC 205120 TaxID=3406462 RepID=UPI003B50B4E8
MPSPSRRTVLRATAWSVPVVSVVATAPAFAASAPGSPVLALALSEGPAPDPAMRRVTVSATNPSTSPLELTVVMPWHAAGGSQLFEVDYGSGWAFVGDGTIVTGWLTVAPSTTAPSFWVDYVVPAGVSEDITLTLSAPGFDSVAAVVTLRSTAPPA